MYFMHCLNYNHMILSLLYVCMYRDDDMQSIASNLSYSKLSVIGILEDDGSMDSRSRGGSFQDEK